MTDVLKRRAAEGEDPGVLLFADRGISYQDIFRVLDGIRMAGIRRISLQSEAEREK
jgi:biopolymer transport protein ExbD